MKIVFITNMYPTHVQPFKGTFVRNVLIGFKRLGCDVNVINLSVPKNNVLSKLIVYVHFFFKSFLEVIRAKDDTVFYIHYTSHSSLGLLIASIFIPNKKLNVVSNVHGSDIVSESNTVFSKIKFFLSSKVLNVSSFVVSPSEYFKNILIKNYSIHPENIIVSPSGGVDSTLFKSSIDATKVYTFGYVGRIEEDKGIFDLYHSFVRHQLNNPNDKLVFVGVGSQVEKLNEMAKCNHGVTILSGKSQGELVSIYQSLKFLVFPSKRPAESLGLIPIEAMMCGVPVICSKIGATGDYIRYEMKRFSFSPGNSEELDFALKNATKLSDEEYQRLSNLAITIAADYSSDKVLNDLYSIFKYNFEFKG